MESEEIRGSLVEPLDDTRMRGYAIVTGVMSQDLGGFREIIAPEALKRTLSEATDLQALVGHDRDKVIGRISAGTLVVKQDSRGLQATIEPDLGISYANDIFRAVKRRDVKGMSFAFRVLDEDVTEDADGLIRVVKDMRVSEVSIVGSPAYLQTDVNVAKRSMQAYRAANPKQSRAYFDLKLKLAR